MLNARAATRETITGVERWAVELIPRLRALAPERYVVAQPPRWATGRLAGQAWEQVVLPLQAARRRAALVFSPANLSPLLWPRNVMMLHDATVLREPAGYSRAYAAWHRWAGRGLRPPRAPRGDGLGILTRRAGAAGRLGSTSGSSSSPVASTGASTPPPTTSGSR